MSASVEQFVMPIYMPAPEHNPSGPDGFGWNRIAVHGLCEDECALKPKTMAAFFDAQDTRKVRYGSFGPCTKRGSCKECGVFKRQQDWKWLCDEMLVRVDENGVPWVMNRPDKGWEEYGVPTTWGDLLQLDGVVFELLRDNFGIGVMMRRVEA